MPDALVLCTIHDGPSDYPRHIVVREWEIGAGMIRPLAVHLFDDVEAASHWLLLQGLTWIGRPGDKIHSVWF